MATRVNTKTITVSFPVELAEQAEQLAKTESRTMSELFARPSGLIASRRCVNV